jgi:hypothetical protein
MLQSCDDKWYVAGPISESAEGQVVAKDKKKKKKDKKGTSAKSVKWTLKDLSQNRLVSEVVAAALVGAASALKDSKKARQLAAHAGDELQAMAKEGVERGGAMWELALDIGRRSLETLIAEPAPKAAKAPKAPKAPKASKAPAARRRVRKPTAKTARRKSS